MEFISTLGRTQSKVGLTPDNLNHLEELFKRTVGDKQEIDLENFKGIVKSKNIFFVERIFKLFDTDQSGAVSLEEFMRAMWCFAQQSQVEKLKYLFEIYDLNQDGTIQFTELREVIRGCMKENGLAFSDEETDELTMMLFEDADTDKSGSITFEKFRAQLERHPGLAENLTMSIESWLLPPEAPKRQTWWNKHWPRKLKIGYIRNNQTSFIFLIIFLLVNLILFVTRAWEYRESNGFVIVARACGQCLNFTSMFVLVLVLRQSLTVLRSLGFSEYFPLDQHLYFHKLTGYFIVFYSYLHTLMHIGNFVTKEKPDDYDCNLIEALFSVCDKIGWVGGAAALTGWILLGVLTIMFIPALPFVRRSGRFEIFYYTHLLFILFWVVLIFHGPNFWKWFLGPAIIFLVESAIRIYRNFTSRRGAAYVQKGVLLPSKVTHLVIKRPKNFDYHPGDYVFINIPQIANYEWHPFTLSSAPEMEGELWLHIRAVGGWTNGLFNYFDHKEKTAELSPSLANESAALNASNNSSHLTVPIPEDSPGSILCPQISVEMQEMNDTPSDISSSLPSENKSQMLMPPTPRSTDGQSLRSLSNAEITMRSRHSDVRRFKSDAPERKKKHREARTSVRVSVARKSFRNKCHTVILLPTVAEDDDEERAPGTPKKQEEPKIELNKQGEENIIVLQQPLRILLDGPYGSPTRHLYRAQHAVLIATGIGVTPFASILQSIFHQYLKSRHTCPNCNHRWIDGIPSQNMQLQKVDFFWLNRQQKAFEWFVKLLSNLEVEQTLLSETDRFLDIHMYITSALHKTDMKALGLQMALDLLHEKEKRDLITGLKTRTQPGRPDWNKVFTDIANQRKGKVTVFFCGPVELSKTLHNKCNEFGFQFRKEIF